MNAARRSALPQHPSRRQTPNARGNRSRAAFASAGTHTPSNSVRQNVTKFNANPQRLTVAKPYTTAAQTLTLSQHPTPAWLRTIAFLQRGSDLVTFLLVIATLTVYSWTVYTQQHWAKEYRKLETLQRNERNLTTANEAMKDQLAQEAEKPATGLVTPNQVNTIVLQPAPQRSLQIDPTPKAALTSESTPPLGY